MKASLGVFTVLGTMSPTPDQAFMPLIILFPSLRDLVSSGQSLAPIQTSRLQSPLKLNHNNHRETMHTQGTWQSEH